MKKQISPRALALQTLRKVGAGQYGNLAVDATIRRHSLTDADRSLYTTLVYGIIERQITLDFLIDHFSHRPTDALDDTVRAALRLGLYQLVYLDRIPDHAAVDETVDLVPKRISGFVNAILRAYLRFERTLPAGSPRENKLDTPVAWRQRFPSLTHEAAASVAFGMPVEIIRRMNSIFGVDRASSVLRAFCDKPPVTLCVNTLRISPHVLADAVTAEGYSIKNGLYADRALRLSGGAVTALPGFDTGDFFVQDEASQLCVAALDAHAGETVIDTCACPGSKSFGIALSMKNNGKLYSFDLHESKLSLITAGAARLGIDIIHTARRDARKPDPALIGKADRVLCDVPCSGLGVMAKKPEIRYKKLFELARLPAIQSDILEASARYLKEGGTLIYSTCTILPEENEQVVTAFLARHPEFEACDFSFTAKDDSVCDICSRNGMVTLLPDSNRTDGFFIAKVRKRTKNLS